MKITKSASLFLLIAWTTIYTVEAQSNKALFSLGDEKHYSDEFKYAYAKNNNLAEAKKDSIDTYLKLYINFRLKVKEAKFLGYDTTKAFKEEFAIYKKQLEDTYLSPKKEQEALIKEAYQRSLWEVKAAHILIRVPADASASDTLQAYKKISSIRNRVLSGQSFTELAKTLSEDPSARQNGGELGYFTVFQMVYPFESAAYATTVGEVSKPIRTQFGYHLIHVEDKRANEGKIRVAHIMIRATEKNGEEFKANAKKKAFKVDSLLKSGKDWNELCQTYSDDQNSKAKNGEIKPFGRGQIVPEFEKAAFQLKNINDISRPIKTQYGWHIIKLLGKVPLGSFTEEESKLARKIKSDARSSMPRVEMLKTLKEQNNFHKNAAVISSIINLPPSVVINDQWNFDSSQLTSNDVLFSVGTLSVTKGIFLESISNKGVDKRVGVKNQLKALLNTYEDSLVISYEKQLLPEKYPDYKFLIQEYYDGILLFSIMEDSVWNLSMQDSLGLEKYYEDNINSYATQVKDTTLFASDSPKILDAATHSIEGVMYKDDWEERKLLLLKKYNESPLTLQVVSKNAPQWDMVMEANTNKIVEIENKWYLVNMIDVLVHPELNEIKGKVISDYQQYLDDNWISELKAKYPVKMYKQSLKKVYEYFKASE